MFKKTVTTLLFSLSLGTALHADKVDPFDLYDWMAALGRASLRCHEGVV